MSKLNFESAIDEVLPDNKITNDVQAILDQGDEVSVIDLGNDMFLSLSKTTNIDIVTKMYLKEYYDIGFGTGYRVQVAIGGIQRKSHGILYAKYCFATLYYNAESRLITADFHKDMR